MDIQPYILWFESCSLATIERTGGKNARLGELINNGFPVPDGFAITTQAYTDFLMQGQGAELKKVLSRLDEQNPYSIELVSKQARQLIESSVISEQIMAPILTSYAKLQRRYKTNNLPLAVRSSATVECRSRNSFAGQQETFLGVTGEADLKAKVRECWSSLYTPGAIAYRHHMGYCQTQIAISVGVQAMLNSRVAGVLFTMNPLNGDRSKIVIEAHWGIGNSLVSGEVDPDRFVIDKVTLEIIARTISFKTLASVLDQGSGGIRRISVPVERQKVACLSDPELRALALLAKKIECRAAVPQDIEWAFDNAFSGVHNLAILQSRPETVWRKNVPRRTRIPRGDVMECIINTIVK